MMISWIRLIWVRLNFKIRVVSKTDWLMALESILLKPNLVYNKAQTELEIEKEIQSIKPITSTLREDKPIFYKGDTITQAHIETLKALKLYGVKVSIFKFTGILGFTFLCFLLLERFIYYFNKRNYTVKHFILTYCVILLIIIIARGILEINPISENFNFFFLIPIPIAAMVVSLLVTSNLALLCGTIISLLTAVMYNFDFNILTFLFFSNCVAAFATFKKHKRSELILAGYIIGIFNMIFIVMIGLVSEIDQLLWYGSNMLLGFGNGIVSSMVSLAILPYFETLFRIITPQSLLELSNLNHPLLKRLLTTAPGTYQHSLMVANLAEAAAESINADVVISKVCAYYHDIGKLKRPMFFIENQFSGENPHDALSPRISKLIISSHVKDGLELAEKHKLPKVIQDVIQEHHGTSLVSFFYAQALEQEDVKNKEFTKDEFRYSGPIPHFKESGIVMLADSVEATIRSMKKSNPKKLETVIDSVIMAKIDDNQLDNCPLSMREIEIIKQTFIRIFKGLQHSRVDYQKEIDSIIGKKEFENPQKNDPLPT